MSPTRRNLLKSIAGGAMLAALPAVSLARSAPVTPVRAQGMYVEFRGDSIATALVCIVVEMSDGRAPTS